MSAGLSCDLCGLPVRKAAMTCTDDGKTFVFCCNGCRQVFKMISEISESHDPKDFRNTDLFKQCQNLGIVPRTPEDIPPERNQPAGLPSEGKNRADKDTIGLEIKITDMWCPACAWFIETALKKNASIPHAACNFSTDRLFITYEPAATSPKEIIGSIKALGYHGILPGEDPEKKETRQMFVRLMISTILTANVMMLSFSVYSGFFISLSRDAIWKIAWPICLMAGVVIFYGGYPIFRKALAGIKSLSWGMETLITAGAFTAFFYSLANLIAGSIHIYFDTASMLITLTLLGKLLERKVKDRVTADLESFFALRSGKARIFSNAYPKGRYTTIENVCKGDTAGVASGEIIPADGVVLGGTGFVDESMLTGEPKPVKKEKGHALTGGTRVLEGDMQFTVSQVGKTAYLGRMLEIMETGANRKMAVEQYAERVLRWFVPFILLLAAGTGVFCLLSGMGTENAMIRAVTVMVIACPCALGIAIPLVRVAGIAIAGKKGILVRNFEAFFNIAHVDTFVFDKTGTVTRGGWDLLRTEPAHGQEAPTLLAMALGLEKDADHDIAFALRRHAAGGIDPMEMENIQISSSGISGIANGKRVTIGSLEFLEKNGVHLEGDLKVSGRPADILYSTVAMGMGDKIAGVFIFGDQIRPDGTQTIETLKNQGFHIHLISGDGDGITKKVGQRLGIPHALGGKLPEDKALLVDDLRKNGARVAVVGDGMNDAPAMSAADVGIAMVAKSHLGRESADITLVHGNLGAILEFLHLAGKVRGKVAQNFWFSFVYNFTSIPLAMSGLLTPLTAVIAMLFSSLTVITNTLLLFRNHPPSSLSLENGPVATHPSRS